MFQIVLRLKADGAKANPDLGLDALPDLNEAHPILRQNNGEALSFVAVDAGIGTVYGALREAQVDWRNIKSGIFTQEDIVKVITTKIGHYTRLYSARGLAHQAFIELQVLNPVKIDSDEVDLETF